MLGATGGWAATSTCSSLVDRSDERFERRAARWDLTELPVPTDVLVYTKGEWRDLRQHGRFCERVMQ